MGDWLMNNVVPLLVVIALGLVLLLLAQLVLKSYGLWV
jgi:hypothetical protein